MEQIYGKTEYSNELKTKMDTAWDILLRIREKIGVFQLMIKKVM